MVWCTAEWQLLRTGKLRHFLRGENAKFSQCGMMSGFPPNHYPTSTGVLPHPCEDERLGHTERSGGGGAANHPPLKYMQRSIVAVSLLKVMLN